MLFESPPPVVTDQRSPSFPSSQTLPQKLTYHVDNRCLRPSASFPESTMSTPNAHAKVLKELKKKNGCVTRTHKDCVYYTKELADLDAKLNEATESSKQKQYTELCNESRQVLSVSQKRLGEFLADLAKYVTFSEEIKSVLQDGDAEAKGKVAEAKQNVEKTMTYLGVTEDDLGIAKESKGGEEEL